MLSFIGEARPAIVKLLHHDPAFIRAVRQALPGTLIVGRKYTEKQPLDNPQRNAEDFARRILDIPAARERLITVWEGYNEVNTNNWPAIKDLGIFDLHMGIILHQHGLQYVAGSYGVGHPTDDSWKFTQYQEVRAAFLEADYIGVHEYYAPDMRDPRNRDEQGKPCWLFRYRNWYPLLPKDCRKPLLVTECGIDSGAPHFDPGAQGGWRSFTHAADYVDQLKWYDSQLSQDRYVKAAAIYCWGTLDPTWDSFDIKGGAADLLRGYLISVQEVPSDGTVEQYVGDVMQRYLIPANPDAAFQRYAWAKGLGSARSREVGYGGELVFEGCPILAQVFMRDDNFGVQNHVCAYLDDPRPWRDRIWHFTRAN